MSSSFTLREFLKNLVGRIALSCRSSPPVSSNTISKGCSWVDWSEDLAILDIDMFEMVMRTMIAEKLDHSVICSFVFDYQKSKHTFAATDDAEKCEFSEMLINLLYLLDTDSVPSKSLFDVFRASSNLKIGKRCKRKLEKMVGSRLDEATLDDLLVPPPQGKDYMFDVNLILRLQRSFLLGDIRPFSLLRSKKASALMDSYLSEVAPDANLRPSKFLALAMAFPDCARDSYDGIYQAVEIYLEVHSGLCEEERRKICSVLNYDKLSPETIKRLSQNPNFPTSIRLISLLSKQYKLKKFLHNALHLKTISETSFPYKEKEIMDKIIGTDKILLRAKKLNFSRGSKKQRFGACKGATQRRVVEPVKICRKTQPLMANVSKSRLGSLSNGGRALPILCHD